MNSDEDTRYRVGCPIRTSRDHRSLASPPGFSQRATSFIASQCQGIHQMPFLALDPRRFRCDGSKLPPGNAVQHRRAQGQNPHAQRPHMKTLLRTHPARLRRARPPRSHDKLSLHPSNNTPARVAPDGVCKSSPNAGGGGERIRTDGPPACKAGALPAELHPLARGQKTEVRDQICTLTSGF